MQEHVYVKRIVEARKVVLAVAKNAADRELYSTVPKFCTVNSVHFINSF